MTIQSTKEAPASIYALPSEVLLIVLELLPIADLSSMWELHTHFSTLRHDQAAPERKQSLKQTIQTKNGLPLELAQA